MTTATSNGLAFSTAQKRRDPVVFSIDDDTYHFTPPKSVTLVLPLLDKTSDADGQTLDMLRASLDYLGAGLPDDEEARLEGRLRDPEDPLDLETIVDVVLAVVKRVTGVPLAGPGASSGSPGATG